MDRSAPSRRAFTDTLANLAELFDSLGEEFASRSVFTRSIAKRRFEKQTGRSLEQWQELIATMTGLTNSDANFPILERWPQFRLSLGRLTDYFRLHTIDAERSETRIRLVTRAIIALEDMD